MTQDMQGLNGLARAPMARRGMVMTTLISGFTLATTRVDAQAITTSMDGIEGGETMVPTAGGMMPTYWARPKGAGPFPVVIVAEEIFGVHEYIRDTVRRLAKAGYMAVAPEIYFRAGDLAKMTDVQQIIRDVISKAPDAQVMADMDAAVAWAGQNGGDTARLAVTGFCRGGRNTWLFAAHNPKVRAAVAWYGPIGGTPSDIQPKTAADVAGDLKSPLLGLYGGKDTGIPVEQVMAARDKANAAGRKVEIVVYPEAPHGFHADYRPSYRAEAAQDGWARMLAFFKQNGV